MRASAPLPCDSHTHLIALNARIRACRKCHLAGLLEDRDSIPIPRDPEPMRRCRKSS